MVLASMSEAWVNFGGGELSLPPEEESKPGEADEESGRAEISQWILETILEIP